MKYEIEIDLPPDVAAKYVPVAVRHSHAGDRVFNGVDVEHWGGGISACRYLIVAPRVEWPGWCSADWIAKDATGRIWAFSGEKPEWMARDFVWASKVGGVELYKLCHAELCAAFKDVPPELSLIENPKRTKSDSAV